MVKFFICITTINNCIDDDLEVKNDEIYYKHQTEPIIPLSAAASSISCHPCPVPFAKRGCSSRYVTAQAHRRRQAFGGRWKAMPADLTSQLQCRWV
jgi:hypothetical protein